VVSPATGGQIQPALAAAADGSVAVAWMSAPGEPAVVGVRVSNDGGATWSGVQTVRSPGDRTASEPALAADAGGSFYLAWIGSGPDGPGGIADSHLYVARAHGRGGPFGPPVEVSTQMQRGARLKRPSLAAAAEGAMVATWGFASSVGDGIGVARSVDGLAWTEDVVIERIGLRATFPFTCSAAHGNRLWVTYLDTEAGVRVRASDDGGATWSPSRGATVSTHDERLHIAPDMPVCAGDMQDVTVAYGLVHDAASVASSSIVIAASSDGGRTFDARRSLVAGAIPLLHPQLAREDDGTLDLAFYAGGAAPGAGALRWVRLEKDRAPLTLGKAARANFRFEPAADKSGWPGESFGWGWEAGNLYAASVDNSESSPHVAFTRIPSK
jgi:hypothetical protein